MSSKSHHILGSRPVQNTPLLDSRIVTDSSIINCFQYPTTQSLRIRHQANPGPTTRPWPTMLQLPSQTRDQTFLLLLMLHLLLMEGTQKLFKSCNSQETMHRALIAFRVDKLLLGNVIDNAKEHNICNRLCINFQSWPESS